MKTKYIYFLLIVFATIPTFAQLGGASDGILIDPDGDKVKYYRDADGDGYGNDNLLSTDVKFSPTPGYVLDHTDCDDTKAAIHPGIVWYRDADGDGFGSNSVTKQQCYQPSGYVSVGGDYNDGNALITNIAPRNFYRDADGDGYGDPSVKTYRSVQPSGYVTNNTDCNDSNASLNILKTWYRDADGDGYGSDYGGSTILGEAPVQSCAQPTGYVANKLDCSDKNAALHPNTVWYRDADGDGYGITSNTRTGCYITLSGYVTRAGDCNDGNASLNPNTVWYRDADGDGWGNPSVTKTQCSRPSGYVSNDDDYNDSNNLITNIAPRNFYRDADNDTFGNPSVKTYRSVRPSGYVTNSSDCNDSSAAINPNTLWYRDADGDGYGNPSVTKKQCTQPSGYVINNADLDDSNNLITTITPRHFYRDADNDTFGNPANSKYQSVRPSGYVDNSSDCNDSDASLNPNTTWYRDADNDGWGNASVTKNQCTQPSGYVRNDDDYNDSNNLITNIAPKTFYADSDRDTYGNPSVSTYRSVQPSGYVLNNSDCNDNDAAINPTTKWYRDADNDGWGNASVIKTQCTQPSGYVRNDDDYDDSNNLIANIVPSNFYRDADGDTFGNNADKKYQSVQPSGYVTNNTDCNDSNAAINPNTVWYQDADGDGWGNTAVTKTQCTQPSGYVDNNLDYNDTTTIITNIAPETFYRDADNDGFGETSPTILASLQPEGYVDNTLDQCPGETGDYGGCVARPYESVGLSDENYIFTRTYQTAMQDPSGIRYNSDVIEGVTYYDGLGRPKQQIAIKAAATTQMTYTNELPMDWTEGSGSTTFFNQNGATDENFRTMGVDPRGERSLLWRCGNDVHNNADGGWNTDYFAVDKNVGYRYTVWVKRTRSHSGTTYHGTRNVNNLSGSANSNPYFWANDLPQLDTWYMIVGVVHPHNYNDGNTNVSGVYDINGNKVLNGNEFKWRDNTETSSFRSYLYYSTDVRTGQYFWNPIVQKLDGTETSLDDMFRDLNRSPKDIVSHVAYDQYGRTTKNYLPYATDGDKGSYRNNALEAIQGFYNTSKYQHTLNPYSETIIEQSPANRVQEQAAPGNAWAFDTTNVTYQNPAYTSYPLTTNYNKFWEAHKLFAMPGDLVDEEETLPILTNNYVKIQITNGTLTLDIKAVDKDAIDVLPTGRLERLDIYPEIEFADLGIITNALGNPTDYSVSIENNYLVISKTQNNPAPAGGLLSSHAFDLTQIQILTGYDAVHSGNATVKAAYGLNNDADQVVRFDVNMINGDSQNPSLIKNVNNYAAGELIKNISKNENWKPEDGQLRTSETFTNKNGQVILQRSYNQTNAGALEVLDTYNVYDDFGNLTYVIPPKVTVNDGVSTTELAELCYQYKYDRYNRLIEKKIPGRGWEYIIYNKLDQVVMTQDANQRAKNEWLFTKYDAFGRVAFTGLHIHPSTITRATMQGYADTGNYTQYVQRQVTASVIGGTSIYYSNDAIPTGVHQIYTVNYYDDYEVGDIVDVNPATTTISWEGMIATANTKGLPTVSQVKVLGTNQWITTTIYYDEKGRAWETVVKNDYLGTTDWNLTKLDFAGKSEKDLAVHQKDGVMLITKDNYTYDHMGRMLTHTNEIDGQAEELIANYNYDELGQLISKNVGGVASEGGLQTVDYTYNIRGWLTGINDVDQIGDDLFTFKVNYDQPQNGATALYNGNISEIHWKTANDQTLRGYTYTYDSLDRITRAISQDDRYNLYVNEYDKMGNIIKLNRKGHNNLQATSFGWMDIMTYTYDSGNKLLKVSDTGSQTYGFKDGANTDNDYAYDANGNMTIDRNKGIVEINYNHLDLPHYLEFNSENKEGELIYTYDAAGNKVRKSIYDHGTDVSTITDYAGNYIYKNGKLVHFGHAEGYIEPKNSDDYSQGFDYIYQFTDHLGNIRLSYSDKDGDGTVDVLRNNVDVDGDGDGAHEILEENNYYPFGLQHKGYNNTISGQEHPYKYNGTELTQELGLNWYEMPLRSYDPAIARWNRIDPVTHYSMSTYNAFDNNPVFYADPSGADSYVPDWLSDVFNNSGDGLTQYSSDGHGGLDKDFFITSRVFPKANIDHPENIDDNDIPKANGDNNKEDCCGNKGIGSWFKAFFRSLFGFGSQDIHKFEEETNNFEDGDKLRKVNKEGATQTQNAIGTTLNGVSTFDFFGVVNLGRLGASLSFEGSDNVYSFYAGINSITGKDSNPFTDGLVGGLSLLTLGSGSAIPRSQFWSNGRVFYSGAGSKAQAIEFARANGYSLVTDMWYGKVANFASGITKGKFDQQIWSAASWIYAQTAKGTVHSFLNYPLRSGNIWMGVERPTLQRIGAGIIYH